MGQQGVILYVLKRAIKEIYIIVDYWCVKDVSRATKCVITKFKIDLPFQPPSSLKKEKIKIYLGPTYVSIHISQRQ